MRSLPCWPLIFRRLMNPAFFITVSNAESTQKILEHIDESTIRPPPLRKPTIALKPNKNSEFIDYIPPVDSYVIDTIYPD